MSSGHHSVSIMQAEDRKLSTLQLSTVNIPVTIESLERLDAGKGEKLRNIIILYEPPQVATVACY